MDDHEGALPAAQEIVEDIVKHEIVDEIVQDKVEERLEDSVAHEVVEKELEESVKQEIVQEIVEEKLEERIKQEVVEDIVQEIVEEKLEERIKQEVVEDIVQEIVEEKLEEGIKQAVAEEKLEESAVRDIVEEVVEDRVEEKLESLAKLEAGEEIAEAVVVESLLEEEIVEDVLDQRLEKKVRSPSLSSEIAKQGPSHLQGYPPPYSEEKPEVIAVATEVQEERQKAEDGTRMKSVLCALMICMGSFAFGTAIGYPSPAVVDINNNPNPFHLDTDGQSWMGSIITLLALFGGLLGGPCMDYLGRRTAIMVWTLPFAVGWIIIMASSSTGCVLAGRAVTGLCTGIFSVICPVYIAEISPPSIRGLLGSCHQMAVCLGIFYIYAFGSFLNWAWAAFACEACLLVLACCLLFIPESPRWLLMMKRREETEMALLWLRGHKVNLHWEMLELEDAIALAQDKASPMEFLQPQLYKPLLISLGLMLFQQFSGINVIMFYGASIFEMAGIDLDVNMQNMLVGAVGVIGTLVSVFIVDLAGRKILLVTSAFIMTLSIGGMGAFFYEQDVDEEYATSTLSWLPVTALVLFNFGFNVAFGPIPWLMMSEVFPLRAKGLASSIATACNWLFAFILTKFWSDMTDAMTVAGAYWFCTAFCALAIPFTIFFVPETKGIQPDEITAMFK